MSKELVLSTKDLTDSGISSQLTANDLVEVVAHDIYDKYVAAVNEIIKQGNEIQSRYNKLLDQELDKMKRSLSLYFKAGEKLSVISDEDIEDDYDEEDMKGVNASFGKVDDYWPGIALFKVNIKERDKGTFVDCENINLYMPNLKDKKPRIKLTLSSGTKYNNTPVKKGAITGMIEESIKKNFSQTISIPITRFANYAEEVYAYNKEVSALLEFLPKNGSLSVERFTREARVKMNKKILSSQTPEFKTKMEQLFQIKL